MDLLGLFNDYHAGRLSVPERGAFFTLLCLDSEMLAVSRSALEAILGADAEALLTGLAGHGLVKVVWFSARVEIRFIETPGIRQRRRAAERARRADGLKKSKVGSVQNIGKLSSKEGK